MADKGDGNISCAICGAESNLKRCGICKCTYYCSREHQIQDWTAHKSLCQTLKINPEPLNRDDCALKSMVEKKGHTIERTSDDLTKGVANLKTNDFDKVCMETKQTKGNENESEIGQPDGISFDKRPLKIEEFLKMNPHESEQMIAKIAVNMLNEKGYCVIDGLFTKQSIKRALKDIAKCETENLFNKGKLGGGRTSGEVEEQVVNSNIRSDKIMWLEGTEEGFKGITAIVARMDSILWEFNKFLDKKYFINGRTKAMVACYPGNGSYYRRHVDNPNSDGRIVTCILYLNEGWNVQEDGGLLRILPADTEEHVDIAPVANRLLFFWCDRRNPHEVHPAYKTRYAITVWYMDEDERKKAKRDCLLGETDKVRGESILKERHQRQIERDRVSQDIESTASDAIASLSIEELKAMADLIANQPDAEEVLANMGIAPNIRTKLLQKLQNIQAD